MGQIIIISSSWGKDIVVKLNVLPCLSLPCLIPMPIKIPKENFSEISNMSVIFHEIATTQQIYYLKKKKNAHEGRIKFPKP